ncbi:arsenate reductase, partial [Escherichia coli]|nr:arsenate reductase [Escherichia coli]
MQFVVRGVLRTTDKTYDELRLAEDKFTDNRLIDFMLHPPIMLNPPILQTPLRTRLCSPSHGVLTI